MYVCMYVSWFSNNRWNDFVLLQYMYYFCHPFFKVSEDMLMTPLLNCNYLYQECCFCPLGQFFFCFPWVGFWSQSFTLLKMLTCKPRKKWSEIWSSSKFLLKLYLRCTITFPGSQITIKTILKKTLDLMSFIIINCNLF